MANEVDLGREVPSDAPLQVNKEPFHPEKAKMTLAYWVLAGTFVFFLVTIICTYFSAYLINKCGYSDMQISNPLWEICRTGLLPIVTLILGYYFSKQ